MPSASDHHPPHQARPVLPDALSTGGCTPRLVQEPLLPPSPYPAPTARLLLSYPEAVLAAGALPRLPRGRLSPSSRGRRHTGARSREAVRSYEPEPHRRRPPPHGPPAHAGGGPRKKIRVKGPFSFPKHATPMQVISLEPLSDAFSSRFLCHTVSGPTVFVPPSAVRAERRNTPWIGRHVMALADDLVATWTRCHACDCASARFCRKWQRAALLRESSCACNKDIWHCSCAYMPKATHHSPLNATSAPYCSCNVYIVLRFCLNL